MMFKLMLAALLVAAACAAAVPSVVETKVLDKPDIELSVDWDTPDKAVVAHGWEGWAGSPWKGWGYGYNPYGYGYNPIGYGYNPIGYGYKYGAPGYSY